MIFALSFLGAVLSRWHGGGYFKAPRWIKNVLWAVIPALFTAFAFLDAQKPVAAVVCGLVSFALCIAGKATGHGQYMSLGSVIKSIKPEKFDFIVSWFFGRDPRCWLQSMRKVLFLSADATLSDGALHDFVKQYGKTKLYWRCVFGLAVIGLASVSGFVFMVAWVNPAAAAIVALGGAAKSVSYMIGWAAFPANKNGIATATGEFLSGAFAYGALGLAAMV